MDSEYRIPLNKIDPNDLDGIRQLIEENEAIFENFILSYFAADDSRYEYLEGSFSVDHIELDHFFFSAMVSYYAGCRDLSSEHDVEDSVIYEIIDNEIVFELNETPWDVR